MYRLKMDNQTQTVLPILYLNNLFYIICCIYSKLFRRACYWKWMQVPEIPGYSIRYGYRALVGQTFADDRRHRWKVSRCLETGSSSMERQIMERHISGAVAMPGRESHWNGGAYHVPSHTGQQQQKATCHTTTLKNSVQAYEMMQHMNDEYVSGQQSQTMKSGKKARKEMKKRQIKMVADAVVFNCLRR